MVNDFEIWYADTFATNQMNVTDSIDAGSVKSSAVPKKRNASPPKIIRDPAMDDEVENEA